MTGTRYFVELALGVFLALPNALAQVPASVYYQAAADFNRQSYAEGGRVL